MSHGFILGLKNYCMYIYLVDEIIKLHYINWRYYVDDTKVYMALKPEDNWNDIQLHDL